MGEDSVIPSPHPGRADGVGARLHFVATSVHALCLQHAPLAGRVLRVGGRFLFVDVDMSRLVWNRSARQFEHKPTCNEQISTTSFDTLSKQHLLAVTTRPAQTFTKT